MCVHSKNHNHAYIVLGWLLSVVDSSRQVLVNTNNSNNLFSSDNQHWRADWRLHRITCSMTLSHDTLQQVSGIRVKWNHPGDNSSVTDGEVHKNHLPTVTVLIIEFQTNQEKLLLWQTDAAEMHCTTSSVQRSLWNVFEIRIGKKSYNSTERFTIYTNYCYISQLHLTQYRPVNEKKPLCLYYCQNPQWAYMSENEMQQQLQSNIKHVFIPLRMHVF